MKQTGTFWKVLRETQRCQYHQFRICTWSPKILKTCCVNPVDMLPATNCASKHQ